jgi:prephenate dehydratase
VRENYYLLLKYKPKLLMGFDLPIELYLIGKKGIEAKYVYSHPQAIEQVKEYINKLGLIPIYVSSTSEAVRKLLEEYSKGNYEYVAIGSKEAAMEYGLDIIDKIELKGNYTRFILIGNKDIEYRKNRTIVMFTLEDRPGSLYKFLEYFYLKNINLTKIESIPQRNGKWKYIFIIEYEGDSRKINKEEMKGKILYIGSYKYVRNIKKYME